jgi:hypothetical protein
MQRSRQVGVIICIVTVLIAAAFIYGIAVQNYWAIAVPVIIGFLGMLALAFWIGWTMAVTEIEASKPELPEESGSFPKEKD